MASLTAPTARTVSATPPPSATPLTEIGISPTPKTHTITNCPGRIGASCAGDGFERQRDDVGCLGDDADDPVRHRRHRIRDGGEFLSGRGHTRPPVDAGSPRAARPPPAGAEP